MVPTSYRWRLSQLSAASLLAAVLCAAPAVAREMPFLDGAAAGALAGPASSVAEGDFDLDGDLDLAATVPSLDEVVWVENAAGSWPVHSITTSYNGPDDLEVADMDCDGDPDVVFGTADDELVWEANDGSGASWSLGAVISSAASTTTSNASPTLRS